jgi:hypothetical protein
MFGNIGMREVFKDSKKNKIQYTLKFRRDSQLSDNKKASTPKLFEVVKV